MQAEQFASLLIPESILTPAQYWESLTSSQSRLKEEQRLFLAILVDGIIAFKSFFQRAEVLRWVASDDRVPSDNFPFLFCVSGLLDPEPEPSESRRIYLDRCRNYRPVGIRTSTPFRTIQPNRQATA